MVTGGLVTGGLVTPRRISIIAVLAAAWMAGASPAGAQMGATLAGRITDSVSDSALASVNVLVNGTLLRAVSNDHGDYRITDVAPGTYVVRVLRLGYESATRTVTLAAGDTVRVNFALARARIQLAPVTVTASRATRGIGDVPASQAVLSEREMLNRSAITLDDALPFVPGVILNHDNVDIRGSTGAAGGVGSRVLFLMDGHPVLTADGGEVDFSSIPLLDVDRVEVIKGAYSALYGSNALGGVVNVITKPIADNAETIVTYHYGAFDQPAAYKFSDHRQDFQGLALQHSRQIGDVGARLMVDREESDGFTQDNAVNRWLLRTRVDLPEHWDHPASIYAIYANESTGNFFMWDSASHPTVPPANTVNDRAHSTKLSIGGSVTPIATGTVRLEIDPYLERDGTQNYFPSDTDYSFHRATRVGTNAQLTVAPGDRQVITVGGEAARTSVTSDILAVDTTTAGSPDSVTGPVIQDYGLYAQDEVRLGGGVSATVGARLDSHLATASRTETTLNPKFGFVYRPASRFAARLSVARGYRAPSAIEEFVHQRQGGFDVVPNLSLHGETAWSSEVGASANVTHWFWMDAAVFQSTYDGLIGPAVIPTNFKVHFANLQRARVRGVDVATKTTLVPDVVGLAVNYTYLDAQDLDLHQFLPYRSRHNLTASLDVLGGLAGVDLRYRSRIETVLIYPADPRSAITLVDLRLGYRLFGSVVQAKITNLFQERYVDIQERTPGQPRTVLLSAWRTF